VPIPVANIISGCQAQLDAEGSEYYLFTQDYKPAINAAQDWLVGVINAALGEKKFSEEIFQDITYARVFQTSGFSRVRIDPAQLGHDVWTILAVEPNCTTSPTFTVQVLPSHVDSIYRSDLTQVNSPYYASRLAAEEWATNEGNPFSNSHTLEAGETARYFGYLNYTNYTSTNYLLAAPKQEIEIRPHIADSPVAIRYAKVPLPVSLVTDNIEFPAFCKDYLVSATLAYMAVKQGDGTTLSQLSDKFLTILLGATS
jgi:hypothetical protein